MNFALLHTGSSFSIFYIGDIHDIGYPNTRIRVKKSKFDEAGETIKHLVLLP